MKLHLDTDIGGDMDDLCALALVLSAPGVELVGVTTVAEEDGRRAGYVNYALRLAGASDVPVAAGADLSLGRFRYKPGYPPDERYWPEPIARAPGPLEDALDLLKKNVENGAVVVAIGQWTNLALLEQRDLGTLASARLVLMGGAVRPVPAGFPQWGAEEDYNVQLDAPAARTVLESSYPTVVPLEVTVQTALRRADLPTLRKAGPLGSLIARQAEEFARDNRNEERYGQTCAGLPDDTINFQHDPLACAVALGWPGVEIETLQLVLEEIGGNLYMRERAGGRPTRVVTRVDGEAFGRFWLETLTEAGKGPSFLLG